MDYPVTNSTIKILKFIDRHENCTFAEIKAKFSSVDFMDLVNLALTNYLLCTRPGNYRRSSRTGTFQSQTTPSFGQHHTRPNCWKTAAANGFNG